MINERRNRNVAKKNASNGEENVVKKSNTVDKKIGINSENIEEIRKSYGVGPNKKTPEN